MPITINDKAPAVSVILGYRDIGLGIIDEPNYKGVGFVQLDRVYKKGEEIPDSAQDNGTLKVCLLVRTKSGLAQLRRAVATCAKSLGVDDRTMLDKITDGYFEEIGDKEVEIEKLKYELKQAQAKVERAAAILQDYVDGESWHTLDDAKHFIKGVKDESQETSSMEEPQGLGPVVPGHIPPAEVQDVPHPDSESDG